MVSTLQESDFASCPEALGLENIDWVVAKKKKPGVAKAFDDFIPWLPQDKNALLTRETYTTLSAGVSQRIKDNCGQDKDIFFLKNFLLKNFYRIPLFLVDDWMTVLLKESECGNWVK
jgi:hypothetical protein